MDANNAQGAMIDLMQVVAKDAGFEPQFVAVSVPDIIPTLVSGHVDVILNNSSLTLDHQAAFAVSSPIYVNSEILLVQKGDQNDYKSWDDFSGKVVITLKGSAAEGPLQESGIFKEVKTCAQAIRCAQAVSTGEATAYFAASRIATIGNLKSGTTPFSTLRAVLAYQPHFIDTYGIGVRKDDPLLAKINASLTKLRADGSIEAIFAKYGIADVLTR